jgi:hypothetical protein
MNMNKIFLLAFAQLLIGGDTSPLSPDAQKFPGYGASFENKTKENMKYEKIERYMKCLFCCFHPCFYFLPDKKRNIQIKSFLHVRDHVRDGG